MKSYHNLQYVFACLSTHSHWVESIARECDILENHFNLSEENKTLLKSFLKNNSKQLWISAKLMDERRWREILPFIKHTMELIGHTDTKAHWYSYLESFTLNQCIPKSTMLEAEAFLNFLISLNISKVWNEVFEYEILRNSVYQNEYYDKNYTHHLPLPNLNKFKGKLNSTFKSRIFDFPISLIIKNLRSNLDLSQIKQTNEHVGVYRDNNSGLIKSIRLNKFTYQCLSQVDKHQSLALWAKHLTQLTNTSEALALELLNKMRASNLIYVTEVAHGDI